MESAEDKRKVRARQSMELLAQQGVILGGVSAAPTVVDLRPLSLDVKPARQFRPACKLVPTAVVFANGQIIVLGKCGEFLRYDLKDLSEVKTEIEMMPPLRGPRTQRRHPYCAKYKKIGPAWENSHHGVVLCACGAFDGSLIVSGGVDCIVNVRSSDMKSLYTLIGDNPVSAAALTEQNCAFADGHRIRVFGVSSVDESASACEIGTLYGPTDAITNLSPVFGENAVLCASDDRTLRYFELTELTQLIFMAGFPLTSCWCLEQNYFIGGGNEGICLFDRGKKEPVQRMLEDRHILVLSGLPGYNIVCAGLLNEIILFQLSDDRLQQMASLPCKGFVNSIAVSIVENQLYLAACGGRERPGDRFEIVQAQPWVAVWVLSHVETAPVEKRRNRFKV